MKTPIFHSYPTWLGVSGVNAWSINLAGASERDSDFEHVVIFTGATTSRVAELEKNGISYHSLTVPAPRKRKDEWRMLKEFLESKAPCIYLPNFDFHRASATPTFSHQVRVCSVVHSDESCYYEQLARVGRACDAIVAVSAQIERNVQARFPELAARVVRIPYGVPQFRNSHRMESPAGAIRLAYCNRLANYQKRVFDLPVVCRELARLGTDFHLTVAGEGPDARQLAAQFEAAGVADRVTFVGRLGFDGVGNVLSSADVFLLTSDFEGLPISLLEAMACGCVPIAYEIASGVRDAVENGVNGILVKRGDPCAMAKAIWRLDADRDTLTSLSLAAVETHARNFSLARMANDYRQLFSSLMSVPRAEVVRDGRIKRPSDLKLYYRVLRRLRLISR